MGISVDVGSSHSKYGIKQSAWNDLLRSSGGPYYLYYKKENDLRQAIKTYFEINDEHCSWNFRDIGYHTYDSGFFGKDYYVSCSNCSKGKINGKAKAEIAVVKITKESADPSRPSDGFFSSDVLEEFFVLWSIQLDMICSKCEKRSEWYGVNTDGKSWGFSSYSEYLAKIG